MATSRQTFGVQRSRFGVQRSADSSPSGSLAPIEEPERLLAREGMILAALVVIATPNIERQTPNVERSYPEWERIFDKNCWARSVPGELKKSALDRSSTISPWSMNMTRLATSLANPIS
jgi:hypothetical protein